MHKDKLFSTASITLQSQLIQPIIVKNPDSSCQGKEKIKLSHKKELGRISSQALFYAYLFKL
ncbi:hypothetical protein SC10_B2orf05539 [Bacillus paralicheniformis]|nr:hypothetical protein SC10_B2orf05539 [Bacillus paralicheniformis]